MGNKENDGLDCFTLRVRNDGDVRRVIANPQPEAIQDTSFETKPSVSNCYSLFLSHPLAKCAYLFSEMYVSF
jgi:hypothetical protein